MISMKGCRGFIEVEVTKLVFLALPEKLLMIFTLKSFFGEFWIISVCKLGPSYRNSSLLYSHLHLIFGVLKTFGIEPRTLWGCK